MLKEVRTLRRDDPKGPSRWYHDEQSDLFLWETDEAIERIELCLRRLSEEKVLSWDDQQGYRIGRVDDGEALPQKSSTPLVKFKVQATPEEWLKIRVRMRMLMRGAPEEVVSLLKSHLVGVRNLRNL